MKTKNNQTYINSNGSENTTSITINDAQIHLSFNGATNETVDGTNFQINNQNSSYACYVFLEFCDNFDIEKVRLPSDLFVFEYIKNLNLIGLKQLKAISIVKAKLPFNNPQNVNKFLMIKYFNALKLKAYVPRSFAERFGITSNVKIGFKGNTNPTLRLCFKCGRFGHIAKFCNAKQTRYLRCRNTPACANDSSATRCLLCGSTQRKRLKNLVQLEKSKNN